MELTDNLNIKQFKPLFAPGTLKDRWAVSSQVTQLVAQSRKDIQDILANKDKRKMVIVGPCSLHDCDATLEYVEKLKQLQLRVEDKILIIMRTYFEKPRTTIGWPRSGNVGTTIRLTSRKPVTRRSTRLRRLSRRQLPKTQKPSFRLSKE